MTIGEYLAIVALTVDGLALLWLLFLCIRELVR